MKPINFETMQSYLQNAATPLNLTVKIYTDNSDKRKKPCFVVYDGTQSISGKMDYIQANMYLHGYRAAVKNFSN